MSSTHETVRMSVTKPPPSPEDIPVLRDVVVPGRAARGQMRPAERRASDLVELDPDPELELEPESEPDEIDDSAIYESLLGPGINTLDIDGAIDRVLDRYAETLRTDLRREFQRLLEQSRKNS